MGETERYQRGKSTRIKVLGAAHVEKAIKAADEFGEVFQQLSTEVCWGEIWTRPELDMKTRSLCTIAILAANGQDAEVKVHTKGALNNGATREEIREVLLHVAVYAGFPAANEAFRAVREALTEYSA